MKRMLLLLLLTLLVATLLVGCGKKATPTPSYQQSLPLQGNEGQTPVANPTESPLPTPVSPLPTPTPTP